MDEPIQLRALEPDDLDRIYEWHNDRSLYEMLGGPFRFVSREAVQAWLSRKTAFLSDEINLAICIKESDKHIGNLYLHQIHWIIRSARLEIFIGDHGERSKGYGQSAIRQLLTYAFEDLGLKKVYLDVLSDNLAAIHIYEKLGFEIEGRLRNQVFKQGAWKDMMLMAAYAEDFTSDWDSRLSKA
jgi:RimJ/RimL family protein N-acetyltransferase